MKNEFPYTALAVAFGLITLLGASLLWVSLTAPEIDVFHAAMGIAFLLAGLPYFIIGIRKKGFPGDVEIGSFDRKFARKPWVHFTISVFFFFIFFLFIAYADSLGLAQTLFYLVFLVLAVFYLIRAIGLRADARSIQEDERVARES